MEAKEYEKLVRVELDKSKRSINPLLNKWNDLKFLLEELEEKRPEPSVMAPFLRIVDFFLYLIPKLQLEKPPEERKFGAHFYANFEAVSRYFFIMNILNHLDLLDIKGIVIQLMNVVDSCRFYDLPPILNSLFILKSHYKDEVADELIAKMLDNLETSPWEWDTYYAFVSLLYTRSDPPVEEIIDSINRLYNQSGSFIVKSNHEQEVYLQASILNLIILQGWEEKLKFNLQEALIGDEVKLVLYPFRVIPQIYNYASILNLGKKELFSEESREKILNEIKKMLKNFFDLLRYPTDYFFLREILKILNRNKDLDQLEEHIISMCNNLRTSIYKEIVDLEVPAHLYNYFPQLVITGELIRPDLWELSIPQVKLLTRH